jgi:tripeptide aminopeptidase
MKDCLERAAAEFGGEVRIQYDREYLGYQFTPDALPIRIATEAWRRCAGCEPTLRPTGGGSDGNVFNAAGIPTVVLSCGYIDAHTVNEHIATADLEAAANWAVHLALVAAEIPETN